MTKFFLIRHGLTDSVGKRLAGRTAGISLNEIGQGQVNKLADRLASFPIAAIYTSPLDRTMQTAVPIAARLNLQPIVCDDFIEVEFGEWTNFTVEEIKKQPEFQLFNSFRSCMRIPGGELMLEAQLRMITGLEKLRLLHKDEAIVVVSHGDLIKSAVGYYAGIHLDMFQRIEISPASVSVIERYDETARITVVNDTGGVW